MQYGLDEKDIRSIHGVFSRYPEIQEVILYGSRAKGNYRPNSDIDLTLEGDDIPLSILYEMENSLDDLLLPYKIDLSIFEKIENQDLLAHIERVGKIFYRKP